MQLTEYISQSLKRLCEPNRPVFAGFSGGADSTALLIGLVKCGASVTAVHFHHGIRGTEAEADAEWCRNFCKVRGIPFILRHLDVPANKKAGESCEEAGRRLRLNAWFELAGCTTPVFLAHHADDCLEELFLRLARGANASSLVPMRESRMIQGIAFIRPLLQIRRAQIEAFLLSEGINDWRIDSTNNENIYRRNAVRNRLLPLFREIFGTDAGLVQSLWALRQDAAHLDVLAQEKYPRHLHSVSDWLELPQPIFARCVRMFLHDYNSNAHISRDFIERVHDAMSRFNGRELEIPYDGGKVYVTSFGISHPEADWKDCEWNWRQEKRLELCNRWSFVKSNGDVHEEFAEASLPEVLQIRHWHEGDEIVPFGSDKPKKVKDIFSDAKIPRHRRHSMPLVVANGEIIWIPGVRRAEFGRVNDGESGVCLGCIMGE